MITVLKTGLVCPIIVVTNIIIRPIAATYILKTTVQKNEFFYCGFLQ